MGEAISGEHKKVVAEAIIMSQETFVAHWPKISRELDTIKHVWEDYWTKDYLYEATVRGRFLAHGFGSENNIRVVTFSQVVMFPAGNILQVVLAFGNSMKPLIPVMEATFELLAKEYNCKAFEIIGRPGWERFLPRLKKRGVVLRCEVNQVGVH